MIYSKTDKHAFRFTKTANDIVAIQDKVFESFPPRVYGQACWAIASFVKERFGLEIVLVALRTPMGDYTPHFINQTSAGNLVDLKHRVSMCKGKVIARKRCSLKSGVHILPKGRSPMDYKFNAIPSDFSLDYRKDTFKEFRQLLKGKIDAPTWTQYMTILRQL